MANTAGIASADVTDGNMPTDNVVHNNHIHETGVLTKQSAPFYSGIAAHNTVTDNLMYNGPRAGINFNDNAGGGDIVKGNIVFNQVRETNDHGKLRCDVPRVSPASTVKISLHSHTHTSRKHSLCVHL